MRSTIKLCSTDQKRIVIAMSGGVDSSVAAYLLNKRKRQSDEMIGLHMNNWNSADEGDDKSGSFCVHSEKDALDSQSVCNLLEMEMRRVSFAGEYWTGVFEPFLEEIKCGKMVNPDGMCTETDRQTDRLFIEEAAWDLGGELFWIVSFYFTHFTYSLANTYYYLTYDLMLF